MRINSYQVVPEIQKRLVLGGIHSDPLGCRHFGRDKTLGKVSDRYFWFEMVEDVTKMCRIYVHCQRDNSYVSSRHLSYPLMPNKFSSKIIFLFCFQFRKLDKFDAEIHPSPVKDKVWHTIGVDMTVSHSGQKQLHLQTRVHMVLLRFFTVLYIYEWCMVKIMDQRREFINKVLWKCLLLVAESIEWTVFHWRWRGRGGGVRKHSAEAYVASSSKCYTTKLGASAHQKYKRIMDTYLE